MRYKAMFFDSSLWTLFWIGVHAMLHVSSFTFHIPQRRNKVYNIIWPEMRWHSLVFAYRSVFTMLALWLAWNNLISNRFTVYFRGPMVLLTMAVADMFTEYYKKNDSIKDETTMRNNPYPNYVSRTLTSAYNLMYSTSQVFGTANILYRDFNSIFMIILPIQIAPFGMTLVKKGLITQAGWHWWYSLAIFANYLNAYLTTNDVTHTCYLMSVLMFCVCRFYYRMNKYVLWSFIIGVQWLMFTLNNEFYQAVLAHSLV